MPDPTWNYLDLSNTTVIFEDTFANFIDATRFNALKDFHSVANLPTSALSIIVHSTGNIPDELVTWTATQMEYMADWNYATNVATEGEYWHSFPAIFDLLIRCYKHSSHTNEGHVEPGPGR